MYFSQNINAQNQNPIFLSKQTEHNIQTQTQTGKPQNTHITKMNTEPKHEQTKKKPKRRKEKKKYKIDTSERDGH